MSLVLSMFPGIDLLGLAFKREGFCVVQGGDVIFGGDVRDEHYPPGRFEGVIGGPPCQAFSQLAHMVRHNGHETKFGNLIPEFERVVGEAQPQWFVMENVPGAPLPQVHNYGTHSFLINNRQFGEAQNRVRRWTFGYRGERRVLMVKTVALESIEWEPAALGSSGISGWDGGKGKRRRSRGRLPSNNKRKGAFRDLCRKQGLPEDFDLPGMTVRGKCCAVGNGVPLAMGRAIARAVREATETNVGGRL